MKTKGNKIKVREKFSTQYKQNLGTSYYFLAKFSSAETNFARNISVVFLVTRIPGRQLFSVAMFALLKATVERRKQLARNNKYKRNITYFVTGLLVFFTKVIK